MFDENFRPYLLELNTNPAITTETSILAKVIPKVVSQSL